MSELLSQTQTSISTVMADTGDMDNNDADELEIVTTDDNKTEEKDKEQVVEMAGARDSKRSSYKIAVTPSNEEVIASVSKASSMHSDKYDTLAADDGGKSTRPLLKSTLKKDQRAWVDPYEPAVQDTFYHKELKQLRPNFDNVQMAIQKMETELHDLFEAGPSTMYTTAPEEDDGYENPEQKLEDDEVDAADNKPAQTKEPTKFGAWDGVFAGCILNIFGVIMFLRVGWIVGQAGVVQAILIMLLSSLVTFLTTLSMSAICTNGTILSGGAYYIISRALGPAVGGAVGVLFSFGNMVAVSLYLIGFAETLVENLGDPIFTGSAIGDVRIWSNLVLCFCLFLALVGLKYVVKANLGLFTLIIITIICFFVGSFYQTASDDKHGKYLFGAKGWSNGNFGDNLGGGYEGSENFWSVLSIFFPAVTGIMAGANISGDLRNPSEDIPKGTLAAVGVSTVTYCIMAMFVGAVAKRSILIEEYLIMTEIAVWDGIILTGIYAATLSSGIAALVGAPRILQAVAQDNVIPALRFFAKTDKDGNPVRGYFLSFAVAAGCNCIGELNFVAPLISEFFMIAYLLINFSCFMLEISKSPGWRPVFQYYNKYSCFLGFALCLGVMFLIDWAYALASVSIGIGIYVYIDFSDPQIKWGSAQSSRVYYEVYKALLRLRTQKLHIKNWRPSILTLTHDPIKHPQLVLFAQTLKKGYGPLFFGTIYKGDYRVNIQKFHHAHNDGYIPKIVRPGSGVDRAKQRHSIKSSERRSELGEITRRAKADEEEDGFSGGKTIGLRYCKGFYEAVLAESFRSGAQNLFQLVGVGNLRPNTVMIGFKNKWQREEKASVLEYVQVLRDALQMRMGLVICVGFEKINWAHFEFVPSPLPVEYAGGNKSVDPDKDKNKDDDDDDNGVDEEYKASKIISGPGSDENDLRVKVNTITGDEELRTVSQNAMALKRNELWNMGQSQPIIDVWWLLDDGGLTMLLPYIMQLHNFWKMCDLRMNLVAEKDDIVNTDVAVIENLIHRFRLPYSTPRVILVESNEPTRKTLRKFEKMAGVKLEDTPRPSVTKRWLKLSELLFEHSRYAGIVVVTLPLPTATFDAKAYMSLLTCMSDQRRMPPVMIMRGNGESSLTFYSE